MEHNRIRFSAIVLQPSSRFGLQQVEIDLVNWLLESPQSLIRTASFIASTLGPPSLSD